MIARLAALVAAAVPCFAAQAHAGPLADALASGDDAAIAMLRGQGDLAARCTMGAIYARRGDLARAGSYLEDCGESALPEDIAGAIGNAAEETLRKLNKSELARIVVSSTPVGIPIESNALPGEAFTTPATLWVRPGTYELRATLHGGVQISTFVAEASKRGVLLVQVPVEKVAQPVREQKVDFDTEPLDDPHAGPPKPNRWKKLIPKKYLDVAARGAESEGGESDRGPELEDPLAVQATPRAPRAHWLGARLAGGMFDDGRAAARAGLGIAATGRYALSRRPSGGPGAFLAARADWSRRGGEPGMEARSTIDVLGAGAGAGLTVLDRGSLSLAVIGQLRADLRLASARAGEPVRRVGVGAAAGAELALPGTPITAGLRFEQGLTEIVAGARDRAVLLEIGVDWR